MKTFDQYNIITEDAVRTDNQTVIYVLSDIEGHLNNVWSHQRAGENTPEQNKAYEKNVSIMVKKMKKHTKDMAKIWDSYIDGQQKVLKWTDMHRGVYITPRKSGL